MSQRTKPHTLLLSESLMFKLVKAGRSPKELAREFGCTARSIDNWLGEASLGGHGKPRKEPSRSSIECEELVKLRREVRRSPDGSRRVLTDYILALLGNGERLRIVQIGANDGSTHDPISPLVDYAPKQVEMIAVEPDPAAFDSLRSRYGRAPNVTCVNAAIGPAGSVSFFRLAEKHWPAYRQKAKQDPTFFTASSRAHVTRMIAVRMKISLFRAWWLVERFRCESLTLLDLLSRHQWTAPEVLQIGINDFTGEIVFDALRDGLLPRVIEYSKKRMSRAEELRVALERAGYAVTAHNHHVCAVKPA
jgi:transposase